MPWTFSLQHLDKVDEVDTNDVEFEYEKESEDEEEIESASDGEDAGDDVSENCSEKDDEPLEFNENLEEMEPSSEKQQRLVMFSLYFLSTESNGWLLLLFISCLSLASEKCHTYNWSPSCIP